MSRVSRRVAAIFPKRSKFSRPVQLSFNCKAGLLYPIDFQVMYPGDKVRLSHATQIRMNPLFAPSFVSYQAYFQSYFVPYRLLMDNFEEFITGGEDGLDKSIMESMSPVPYNDVELFENDPEQYNANWEQKKYNEFPWLHSTWDMLGLPLHPFKKMSGFTESPFGNTEGKIQVDRCVFKAVDKVWNEWYRNQNLEEEIEEGSTAFTEPNRVHWERDYFTESLPFQQRGIAPALPLYGTAPIKLFDSIPSLVDSLSSNNTAISFSPLSPGVNITRVIPIGTESIENVEGGFRINSFTIEFDSNPGVYQGTHYGDVTDSNFTIKFDVPMSGSFKMYVGLQPYGYPGQASKECALGFLDKPVESISFAYSVSNNSYNSLLTTSNPVGYADLDLVSSASINDQRLAFQTQVWMERNARAGVRYSEFCAAHWGYFPADERLQRSEYVGGCKFNIITQEVVQTSSTTAQSPQGNLAGKGIGVNANKIGTYTAKEYGIILTFMFIRPRSSYASQGVDKKWQMRSKFDFFTPEFAHLGPEAIFNSELFVSNDNEKNNGIFGYTNRADYLRFSFDKVMGDLRPDVGNQPYWTIARAFSDTPTLSSSFTLCKPDNRIFTYVGTEEEEAIPFTVNMNLRQDWIRPMPYSAEPGYLDHPYI